MHYNIKILLVKRISVVKMHYFNTFDDILSCYNSLLVYFIILILLYISIFHKLNLLEN